MATTTTHTVSLNGAVTRNGVSTFVTILKSNLKRRNPDGTDGEPQHKKQKKSIAFDNVSVFYFPRAQGFTCVPSQVCNILKLNKKLRKLIFLILYVYSHSMFISLSASHTSFLCS